MSVKLAYSVNVSSAAIVRKIAKTRLFKTSRSNDSRFR